MGLLSEILGKRTYLGKKIPKKFCVFGRLKPLQSYGGIEQNKPYSNT